MRAISFHHDRARTQRSGKLRILLLGVGLVVCWILFGDLPSLQPFPGAEAIRLTQEQGYVVDKPVWSPGMGRLLLQQQPEGWRHSQAAAALTNGDLHAAAWRMADEARRGNSVAGEELETLVDSFARMLSGSDHYKGDAAFFVEEVNQWRHAQPSDFGRQTNHVATATLGV